MLLLTGQTLTPAARFTPAAMSLSLTDPGVSTAAMTLTADMPQLTVGAWLLDDVEPGAGIVWRVKSLDETWETGLRSVQLEHISATLKDALIFGEIKTKAISGGSTATARQAAEKVLTYQSLWRLGDCDYTRALPYTFNNTTVYAALESISSTLDGWRWEYDLTAIPFTLHIRRRDATPVAELRAARNLCALKRTLDRSQMYTRFYPVGARNKKITGGYVSRNEDLYGVICKTETDQSISSEEMLRAWAEDKLSRHAEPTLTITATALELSRATGEPLDHIRLGYACRIPLPEYGVTLCERVTRLNWTDKLAEPEKVTVTLANALADVTTILKATSGGASRNAAGSAAAQEEDHAWISDTTDHVTLTAEAIIGKDGDTVDWSRVATLGVDGNGIHGRVTKAEGDLVVAQTAITANETAIQLEAQRAAGAEGTLTTRINQTADSLGMLATTVEDIEDGLDEVTGSALWINRNSITTVAGKFAVVGDNVRLLDGAQLQVSEGGVFQTVGTVNYIDDQVDGVSGRVSTIEGSALWQTRDAITAVAGKMEVVGGDVRLKSGAQLKVQENGVYQTVGTVSYTDSQVGGVSTRVSTIEGSTLWTTRDAVTAATGKMTVDASGNIHLTEGSGLFLTRQGAELAVVDAAGVKAAINASPEQIKISASKINLDGYVTATELSATDAKIDNLKNGTTQANHLDASLVTGTTVTARNTLNATTNFNFKNHAISIKDITINGTAYHLLGYT